MDAEVGKEKLDNVSELVFTLCDFGECFDWTYLPRTLIQSLMHVDWRKTWKRGGLAVASEIMRSLALINTFPFFIKRKDSLYWAGPTVDRLLGQYGIKVIAGAYWNKEYFFSVNERWAKFAQGVMGWNGVPFTPHYNWNRIKLTGDIQAAEARARRPSVRDLARDAWGQACERRSHEPGKKQSTSRSKKQTRAHVTAKHFQVGSIIMKAAIGIALVMMVVWLMLAGCRSNGPTPEELARADQIRAGTDATAAAAALTIKNRIAEATAVAPATAAVLAARVSSDVALAQATAVVATARAGSDVTTAQDKPTKDWMSFVLMLAMVSVLGLILYWFAMRVRRASMRYAKTATGVVAIGEDGRLFNSSTMVESTITPATEQADLLWQLERVRKYLATGKVMPLPEAQKPLLTDGDATAEQRARVAVTARTGDALAAAMDSKISERERQERMALLRGRQPRGLMGDMSGPALPAPVEGQGQTNVTVIKPSVDNQYLQLMASALGVPVKALAERSQQDAMIIDQAWVASEKK